MLHCLCTYNVSISVIKNSFVFIQLFIKTRIHSFVRCHIFIAAFPAGEDPFPPCFARTRRILGNGCVLSCFHFLDVNDSVPIHKCHCICFSAAAVSPNVPAFINRMESCVRRNVLRISIPAFENISVLCVRCFFRCFRRFGFPAVLHGLCADGFSVCVIKNNFVLVQRFFKTRINGFVLCHIPVSPVPAGKNPSAPCFIRTRRVFWRLCIPAMRSGAPAKLLFPVHKSYGMACFGELRKNRCFFRYPAKIPVPAGKLHSLMRRFFRRFCGAAIIHVLPAEFLCPVKKHDGVRFRFILRCNCQIPCYV